MKNKFIIFALLTLGCTLYLSTAWGNDGSVVKPTIPKTEAECTVKGGSWSQYGPGGRVKLCNLKTTDAGTSCTDSNQCQSVCYARKDAILGSKDTGECGANTAVDGCFTYVEGGVVDMICVD